MYTYRAHVFLMHSCCTVIFSLTSRTDLTHHAWLENYGAHCLCLSPKHSHFIAQCRTSHLTWWHRARALLPRMFYILLSASTNSAEIYGHTWVALWLTSDPLRRSSGRILNVPLFTKICWESMEKQLNSSGNLSQDLHDCSFFNGFRMICESGSVNVQRHRLDKKRKWWKLYSKQKSQGTREEILARTLDVLRSWRWKEVVRKSSLYT